MMATTQSGEGTVLHPASAQTQRPHTYRNDVDLELGVVQQVDRQLLDQRQKNRLRGGEGDKARLCVEKAGYACDDAQCSRRES